MNKVPKDDLEFLEHIIEAIDLIEGYTKNVRKEDFIKNNEKHDAVVRELTIMGEAAKKISESFKSENPSIEWKKLSGIRDVIVHQYFRLNLSLIWEIVQSDLSGIKEKLKPLLKD